MTLTGKAGLSSRQWRIIQQLVLAIPDDVIWALTGSASFALQGLAVQPGDIDLQTDETGAYAIQRLFADHVSRPVRFSSTDRIRSHYGALLVDGEQVELMGALQKRLPSGEWEVPVDVVRYRQFITPAGWRIPVMALTYEQRAYQIMGREERAAQLAAFIAARDAEGDEQA